MAALDLTSFRFAMPFWAASIRAKAAKMVTTWASTQMRLLWASRPIRMIRSRRVETQTKRNSKTWHTIASKPLARSCEELASASPIVDLSWRTTKVCQCRITCMLSKVAEVQLQISVATPWMRQVGPNPNSWARWTTWIIKAVTRAIPSQCNQQKGILN